MNTQEYIESGILELFVFGKLSETEMEEVAKMAESHSEIRDEIFSIEKAVVLLSSSVAPRLSGKNYEDIKKHIFGTNEEIKTIVEKDVEDDDEDDEEDDDETKVIPMATKKTNWAAYVGWAASLLFAAGIGYQYIKINESNEQMVTIENEKSKLKNEVIDISFKNKENETLLALIRDNKNTIIPLDGQEVAPTSFAKVYWNKETETVFVDGAGLPEPPEGMVYQVWALKLNPLTPLSIGLLDDFKGKSKRIFEMENVVEAEAFGITLEPAGGSASPTLTQLYTLGKV